MEYYVKIFERWTYGNSWGYKVYTNDINSLRESLKRNYDRFTITEVT